MKTKLLTMGIATAVMIAGTADAEVTPERLLAAGTEAEAGNWLTIGKGYDSNRYPSLSRKKTHLNQILLTM